MHELMQISLPRARFPAQHHVLRIRAQLTRAKGLPGEIRRDYLRRAKGPSHASPMPELAGEKL